MPHRVVPDGALPCVWMSAGLLSYKLCDRDFDCDHCPLDAGLRGGTMASFQQEALLAPRHDAGTFPEDRRYSRGHSWVMTVGRPDDRRERFGLDAFAAAIIGQCRGVRCQVSPKPAPRGEAICQVDLGLAVLSVRAPVGALVVDVNRSLQQTPNALVTAPYSEGWILEFQAVNPAELGGLMAAEQAREETRMDLLRFRRRVATQILADNEGLGKSVPDGGELVTDLRQILGGSAYLDILRELIF